MKQIAKVLLAVLTAGAMCLAQGAQPAAGGRPQPQIKSQQEFQAYQEAASKTAPAELERAVMEFAIRYPKSEITSILYLSAMQSYQSANNAEKTLEMAHKVLQYDPNSPEALVTVANVLAEKTRETDLDREERLAEAVTSAEKALKTTDTDLLVPPNTTPEQVESFKNVLKGMAHSALGTVEIAKKNYPAAEKHLETATQINTTQPDAVSWIRLAVAREQQKKMPQALEAANQAVKIAPQGSQAATLAKTQRDRIQKMLPPEGAAVPAATAAPGGGASAPQASPQ